MENILVICEEENEKQFIKRYLYGINYNYVNNKYDTGDELITVVEPNTSLTGSRFHRVFFDNGLEVDAEYLKQIKDFSIKCNKCESNNVRIDYGSVGFSYVILVKIKCENCKHTEQIG
ncbi:hypothetical protein [Psychrobacillus phage Perkons]|nr:hypothetical protein [Psychrobacillus phage Perkons]